MPNYSYEAIDRAGRRVKGTLSADSEANLELKLNQMGAWVTHSKLQKAGSAANTHVGPINWMAAKVKRRELIDFCTVMVFQTRVGIPMVQALAVAAEDCETERFRSVLKAIQREIEGGKFFHEAMDVFPEVFSLQFRKVLRAGETSGQLPEAFSDLGKNLVWTEKVLAEVRQASIYPAIVLSVVLVFIIGLFTFVIPKFAALLNNVHVQLPLLTQIIFGLSHGIRSTWWLWLIVVPSLISGLLFARRVSKSFALKLDRIKLKLPVFGEINLMLSVSRFSHNFSMLYRSGIPVVQALDLCQGMVGSPLVETALAQVSDAVKTGSTISEAIRKHPVFPPLLLRMIIIGESTGTLDTALQNVSDYYNEVIPRKIKALLTMFEPALTVSLILLVGCVALSIYLPVLSLMGAIH